MDPKVRNFSQIEKFIRENPRSADAQAFEWQQFLKTNVPFSPELSSMENPEEFYRWASEHPEKNIDASVWVGKEISEAYYYLRRRHEDYQMSENGVVDLSSIPISLVGATFLAASFLQKPKIMEDDRDYQKTEDSLKKEWLKKNNAKDFSSKEGLDYLYGSLDDKSKTSLGKEAEKVFRGNPKYQKRVERYDKEAKKIYKKPDEDPRILAVRNKTQEEIQARTKLFEKSSKNSSQLNLPEEEIERYKREISTRVSNRVRSEFIQKNPEKAAAYFKTHESAVNKNNSSSSVVFEGNPVPQASQFFATNIPHSAEGIAGSSFTTDNFSGGSSTFFNTNAPSPMGGAGQPSPSNYPSGTPGLLTTALPGAKIGNPLGEFGQGNTMRMLGTAVQAAAKGLVGLLSKPAFWAAFTTALVSVITFFSTLFTAK